MEPTNILIATANDDLLKAFNVSFQRFYVQILHARSYSKAIEKLQNGVTDLLITDYFLEAGSRKEEIEEAFEVRNWEIDTIEHDMKIVGFYRKSLFWLRNLIAEANKEKLFPLGRRLSIEADLLPTRSVLILPHDPMHEYESEDVSLYFSLYRDNKYYPGNDSLQKMTDKIVKLLIKNPFLTLTKVYGPRNAGFSL